LIAAGALFIGKTNLNQFATGSLGALAVRDLPVGFRRQYISGGSSSGSAVAVASGMVRLRWARTPPVGRVPAAFNNIVGHKPTRGLLSNRGVFPACRIARCVSIFAGSCHVRKLCSMLLPFDERRSVFTETPKTTPNFLKNSFRFCRQHSANFFDAEAAALYESDDCKIARLWCDRSNSDLTRSRKPRVTLRRAGVAERRWALGRFFVNARR